MTPPHPPAELRPSARRILRALYQHGELTARELVDETGLASSTVKGQLISLKRRGFVSSRPDVLNPRADVYSLRKSE